MTPKFATLSTEESRLPPGEGQGEGNETTHFEPTFLSRETTPYQRTVILSLALSGLLLLYFGTVQSMVFIWWRSETFAHGFFILPISVFLIWRKRSEIARIPTHTDFRALAILVPLGFLWMLADTIDVLVVKQFAFVAMIPTIVWLISGRPMLKALAFPLAYLLLAVPVGEGLILPMQKMTAAATVYAVRLSGVPVYWEGFFITLPTGSWNVVEGCAGVRYLIASVTVGILYAYLTYRSLSRRIAFIALSIAAPIVANWFRAYMIVMIGHLSNMKYATGIDEFIYGWVWFGIVILIMFWIGSFWREDTTVHPQAIESTARSAPRAREALPVSTAGLLGGLLVIAVWPALGAYMEPASVESTSVELSAPLGQSEWRPVADAFTAWKPKYLNATAELKSTYQKDDNRVGVYLAYYSGGQQDSELVNSQNVMIEEKHPIWRQPYLRTVTAEINSENVDLRESEIESSNEALLVWHWYWIAGQHISSPYEAKLREAIAKFSGGDGGEAGIVIFTPRSENRQKSRAVLQRFLDDMISSIEVSIKDAANR